MTVTTQRRRRRRSLKRKALAEVFGRPWEEVALEWDAKPLTLEEIAAEWTKAVGARYPRFRFGAHDVCRAIQVAEETKGAAA